MSRITPEIDVAILMELSNGTPNKTIAERFGVSPSYVSKLRTGKKLPYVHIASLGAMQNVLANKTDIEATLAFLMERDLLVTREQIISFLEDKIRVSIVQAKIYQELLNKYKGE